MEQAVGSTPTSWCGRPCWALRVSFTLLPWSFMEPCLVESLQCLSVVAWVVACVLARQEGDPCALPLSLGRQCGCDSRFSSWSGSRQLDMILLLVSSWNSLLSPLASRRKVWFRNWFLTGCANVTEIGGCCLTLVWATVAVVGGCMCGKSPRFDASFRTSRLAWWGAALVLFLISGVVIMVWTASMWPAVLTPVILSFVCRWHSLVPFQQLRIWTWCLSGHADVTARGGYGMIFVWATVALLYGWMRGVFPWFHASFRASRNAWLGVALLLLQICGVITTVWTVSVQPVELTYFPYNVDRTVWLPRSLRSMEMVDWGPPSTILVWVEDRPCLWRSAGCPWLFTLVWGLVPHWFIVMSLWLAKFSSWLFFCFSVRVGFGPEGGDSKLGIGAAYPKGFCGKVLREILHHAGVLVQSRYCRPANHVVCMFACCLVMPWCAQWLGAVDRWLQLFSVGPFRRQSW